MPATLPLPFVPSFIGSSRQYMHRMSAFVEAVPDIFNRVKVLGLERSYTGLRDLRFIEKLERGSSCPVWLDKAHDVLNVYPMAFQAGARLDLQLYAALGTRYWFQAVPSGRQGAWVNKLIYPDRAVIERLAAMLKLGTDYRKALDGFHLASERLQVIHVLNALIANHVSANTAKTVNLDEYPPTREFCGARRPYSLKPLLSVYTGPGLAHYETAFAQYCSHNGKIPASEPSTESALAALFDFVTFGK